MTVLPTDCDDIVIREALPEDAADLLPYVHQISHESDFFSFGPGAVGRKLAGSLLERSLSHKSYSQASSRHLSRHCFSPLLVVGLSSTFVSAAPAPTRGPQLGDDPIGGRENLLSWPGTL